jgi:hypothetical protein
MTVGSFSFLTNVGLLIVVALFNGFLFRRPIIMSHSIKVHPQGLIVEGRYFSVEDIGDNWPQVRRGRKPPSPCRLICTTYRPRYPLGTRRAMAAGSPTIGEAAPLPACGIQKTQLAVERGCWVLVEERVFTLPPAAAAIQVHQLCNEVTEM